MKHEHNYEYFNTAINYNMQLYDYLEDNFSSTIIQG